MKTLFQGFQLSLRMISKKSIWKRQKNCGQKSIKKMSAEDKLKEFEKLWYEAVQLKKAHYRDTHPNWSEDKIQKEVRE